MQISASAVKYGKWRVHFCEGSGVVAGGSSRWREELPFLAKFRNFVLGSRVRWVMFFRENV